MPKTGDTPEFIKYCKKVHQIKLLKREIGGKTNIGSALPVVYLEFGAYFK